MRGTCTEMLNGYQQVAELEALGFTLRVVPESRASWHIEARRGDGDCLTGNMLEARLNIDPRLISLGMKPEDQFGDLLDSLVEAAKKPPRWMPRETEKEAV